MRGAKRAAAGVKHGMKCARHPALTQDFMMGTQLTVADCVAVNPVAWQHKICLRTVLSGCACGQKEVKAIKPIESISS